MASARPGAKTPKARIIGGWSVSTRLGKGGNGEVFRAQREQQVGAIKLLGKNSLQRAARFRDEVTAMRRCSDIAGVLPVLDEYLEPERGESPWFVMGLATPISEALGAKPSLRQVVEACAEIATTLSAMHARGLSHRDIKPDNLFRFASHWSVGDFGLVSFEGKTAETARGERVGPMFFMAPEMLNSAVEADGRCADVFSLAKTLWVLATGQRYPLPGHYDITIDAFRIATYLAEERTGPLDKLISSATLFSPDLRPTMGDVAKELRAWLAPRTTPSAGVQLNTANFAAELERRKLAIEATREREKSAGIASEAICSRLREALRPLADEVADSLQQAHFEPVNLNVDRFHWGFEVAAGVPAGDGSGGLLRLIVGIKMINGSTAELASQIVLDRTSPTTFGGLLWDKTSSFLEGGSMEDAFLQQLRQDVIDEMPKAVSLALAMILGGAGGVRPNSIYSIGVESSDRRPLQDAEVLLIDPEGVYLRATSDHQGIAKTGVTHLAASTVFVAHPGFHGEFLPLDASVVKASLMQEPGVSSMIAMRGWTSVKGLVGQIQLIADEQKRIYIYGENVAIDGGQTHPVHLSLGRLTKLRGADGAEISFKIRAVSGPCFLLDVYGPQSPGA